MANPQGIVNAESVNKTTGRHVRSRSHFPDSLSYRNGFTARFGEYTPSFVMEGVPDDTISVNTHDLVDSLSLKAPFKGSIRKVKESFSVPNMALLPINWDLIYTQPSNGDDVPADANCVLQNFPAIFSIYWSKFYDNTRTAIDALTASSTLAQVTAVVNSIVKTAILGEYVYSYGSLLHLTGYKAARQFMWQKSISGTGVSGTDYNPASYDSWFDAVIKYVFTQFLSFTLIEQNFDAVQTNSFKIRSITSSGQPGDHVFHSSFRFFLEKMRENPACYITDITFPNGTTLANFITRLKALTGSTSDGLFEQGIPYFYLPDNTDQSEYSDMSQCNLNLSRLLAYQIVCAHYYSNSSVDAIYSAELYRQYVLALHRAQYSSTASLSRFFVRNGLEISYDCLSEAYIARVLYLKPSVSTGNTALYFDPNSVRDADFASITDPTNVSYRAVIASLTSFAAIFGFRKSLRFGDYFVGSRPRPLAPINTDVSVNNNMVSVIDITRGIQAQRFGNAVMRSRQKIEEYVGALFGKKPAPDFHNPFFLTRETEIIFGDEVQNTGTDQLTKQNSRTSLWASNGGRFTFTFNNDDAHPCIYIQIISFDVKRAYTDSVDRQFLHLNRFDMFNPDFQFIGDQPIYGIELGYPYGSYIPKVFAYQSRDMEYKQRFDVASGGFVEMLPGWLLTDHDRDAYQRNVLNGDFIRSFSTELDQFYVSLTGYSLGNYFHFAIITDNNVDATRPMSVDPQILE